MESEIERANRDKLLLEHQVIEAREERDMARKSVDEMRGQVSDY
jgi:hypothetical protein